MKDERANFADRNMALERTFSTASAVTPTHQGLKNGRTLATHHDAAALKVEAHSHPRNRERG